MSRRLIIVFVTALLAAGLGATTARAAGGHWYPLLQAINRVRRTHGLRPVEASPRLHEAARRHSADMLARDYFAHTSPTGSTLLERILHSGFLTEGYWEAGETLAWGTGSYGTPNGVVKAWLASPEHRAIVLSPIFRFVGIGRAQGTFMGHPGADIWTADWGHR
ncbi:MAG TPA: CAP domain-containing protein [Gaiellales bacterium]|jgi:uncharacterized protein YkwD